MWDRMVDDPRLSCRYGDGDALPHPVLAEVRAALSCRYGAPFGAVGLNYYRDGADSVASHADRELRELDDALVAIVTLGARRPFLLRPKDREKTGGRSIDLAPASGDLLVMGGACQAGWEHGVPKVVRAGPRISATWRWARRAASDE
jgi:alkylated DNA repair dioxygenase AlkB